MKIRNIIYYNMQKENQAYFEALHLNQASSLYLFIYLFI